MSAEQGNEEGINIFVDQPELQKIVLDFPKYAKSISNIIMESTPQFTVGIFGDWGTGKTTLMKKIRKNIMNQSCKTLEFNAWRYEGEKRNATFPLMLDIIGNLLNDPQIKKFLNQSSDSTKEKIMKKISRVFKGLSGSMSVGIPGIANFQIDVDPTKMTDDNKQKIKDIEEFYDENKPILQAGVEIIEFLLDLKNSRFKNNLKLVIFIDDLDRCTPEKAAEVLESIKVFFDLLGIVFVLGLSKTIVETAIDIKYREFDKMTFNGSDYIKKIIQVPFTLPNWTVKDIDKYIDALLLKQKNKDILQFFNINKSIISQAANSNPREVKRLLNNFILAKGIYERDNIDDQTLLVIQALSIRWKWFYDFIIEDPRIAHGIGKKIFGDGWVPSKRTPKAVKTDNALWTKIQNVLNDLDKDTELVSFLYNHGKVVFDITKAKWSKYRRASEFETEFEETEEHENNSESAWGHYIRKNEEKEQLQQEIDQTGEYISNYQNIQRDFQELNDRLQNRPGDEFRNEMEYREAKDKAKHLSRELEIKKELYEKMMDRYSFLRNRMRRFRQP